MRRWTDDGPEPCGIGPRCPRDPYARRAAGRPLRTNAFSRASCERGGGSAWRKAFFPHGVEAVLGPAAPVRPARLRQQARKLGLRGAGIRKAETPCGAGTNLDTFFHWVA